MQARFSILSLFAASLVTLAGFSATPGFATEGVVTSSSLEMITPVAAANSVETHEFHLRNARIPSLQSSRQNVTAWQVDHGSWNGQTLNGLSVVLVQSVSEGGMPARLTNCYVSHEATPAQRTARWMRSLRIILSRFRRRNSARCGLNPRSFGWRSRAKPSSCIWA